jgi:hypothetical protein
MEVQFKRSGTRRYGVTILRPGLTPFGKDPAPGYDELVPHDLVHFIVERELRLKQGIFGQVAAGGTAGTFFPIESDARNVREASRRRRSLARRSEKLMLAGRRDTAASELAAYVVRSAWDARRTRKSTRDQTNSVAATLKSSLITHEQLARMCAELDLLSARWTSLKIGEAISLNWEY